MCECDNKPNIGHISGDIRGWYIAITPIKYLHKDGKVQPAIRNTKDAFWETKEDAQKFLDLWERKGWFQIKDCEELSIGDSYFYFDIDDLTKVTLAEFDGSSFSCEAETLEFEDDFAYGDFWFQLFEWPELPKI